MTPEQLAIAALWAANNTGMILIIKTLWSRNQTLEGKLDVSNEASRNLIAIQAQALKDRGVQLIAAPPEGG